MAWIDRIPLGWLVFGAVLMGLAPVWPQPHLAQKIAMLVHGELRAPLDVFDLCLHGALPLLLAIRLVRMARSRRG